MNRIERKGPNSVTYTYADTNLSKEEMLGYFIDILKDDDITANGLIMIAPTDSDRDWPGAVTEIPEVPDRAEFVEQYKESALSGMTAIMQYHGQQMMITYRPSVETISVILPREFGHTIDEIERNVIPDAIDENPGK